MKTKLTIYDRILAYQITNITEPVDVFSHVFDPLNRFPPEIFQMSIYAYPQDNKTGTIVMPKVIDYRTVICIECETPFGQLWASTRVKCERCDPVREILPRRRDRFNRKKHEQRNPPNGHIVQSG